MKRSILTVFVLLIGLTLLGQSYNMSNDTIITCSGVFYDSGGSEYNYSNGENKTMVFISANGHRLRFDFQSFQVESGWDKFKIYDGPNINSPFIGEFSGSTTPGVIVSTGTSLTFVFTSDGSTNYSGWAAVISCTTPALVEYLMSTGTVTTCSALFTDSGGSNGNYGNNEDATMTFCSTGSDYVTVTFLNSGFNLAAGDTLFAYDGPNTSSPMIGAYCGTMIPEPISSQTGSCITFRFKSDLTAVGSGWRAIVDCSSTPLVNGEFKMMPGIRYTCGGVFYDSGGPNGNYKNNESNTLTFVSSENRRLQFNFQAFYTEVGDNLYIYDGPTTNHPLIGVYSGSAGSPGIVQSTGASMTFRFVSDGSYTYPGWAALISCTTPALPVYNMSNDTVFACEGVFYDSGGPDANYMHNDNRVMTFCSENEEFIHFTFQPNNFKVHLSDTLYVYDGASVSAPIIGKYTGDRLPEVISSLTGSCLTFKFVSDLTNHDAGWQAIIGCTDTTPAQVDYRMQNGVRYTCGGIFYDSGGLDANYSANESYTETFVSSSGSRLQFNFQVFNTESTDKLYIYDGPTVNHPLIGVYSGSAGSPGIVQSSGTSLTFKFVSDQNTQYAGWAALITCTTPALPVYHISNGTVTTCEGVFYDSGGPNANYPYNETREMTFCSENEEFIYVTFQPNNFNVHLSDTLFVYDGPDSSAPPIGFYYGNRLPETISSQSGSCLTFKFVSNYLNHDLGWQALIDCDTVPHANPQYFMQNGVRYVSGGRFYDSGGPDASYKANESYTETFISALGTRLQFEFLAFSTESYDKLYIYDGPTVNHPIIGVYSGGMSGSPGIVQSTGTSLTFKFVSDNSTQYAGWQANISCTTAPLPTYNMSNTTITTCEAVFYDSGGPTGNYSNNEDLVMTFCSADSSFVKVDFTRDNLGIYLGDGDMLKIYDGPSTSSTPLAIIYGYDIPEAISSITGSCLTFQFISSTSNVRKGWQAIISCVEHPIMYTEYRINQAGVRYVCEVDFYDTGGPNGAYGSSENLEMTFCSNNDCNITAEFEHFYTENSIDKLYIYDGMSVNDTWLYTCTGNTFPQSVTSSNQCLTFKFVSDYSANYSGWKINLNCNKATITASPSAVACDGDPVNLTANQGVAYIWSTGDTTQTITVHTPGYYAVTVTNESGCNLISDPFFVQYVPITIPTVTPDGTVMACPGQSVNLVSSQGTSYLWSHGATARSVHVVTPGQYWVTVTDVNGCQGVSDTITIQNYPVVQPSIIPSGHVSICYGDSLQIGTIATNFVWNNGSVTNSIHVHNAGIYYLIATDTNGCATHSDTLTLSYFNPNPPTITPSGQQTICEGSGIVLTASSGNAYNWSTGANTQSISVVAAGNYVVTVTDENECSRPSAPVVVNINPLPPTPTISVNEGLLQATPSSGYTFKWYFNGTLISGANLSFYWPTQNGVYMVEITDQLGCSSVSAPYNVQFVGIDENIEDVFTKLYPNPLTTQTTLLINTPHSAYLHVECFDVTGKKIATIYQGNLPGGATEIDIDAQQLGLVSGTYILRILCDNQMIHHKMMISNR